MSRLINIGFGNVINTDKVMTIISPDSAPAKRIIQRSKEEDRNIDATQGRKTKAVIVTDTNMVVLSALTPETLAQRYNGQKAKDVTVHGGDEELE